MCVMTSLGILGLLGWGAYSAGKSAWKHRSNISQFAVTVFNMPYKVYQAEAATQKRIKATAKLGWMAIHLEGNSAQHFILENCGIHYLSNHVVPILCYVSQDYSVLRPKRSLTLEKYSIAATTPWITKNSGDTI